MNEGGNDGLESSPIICPGALKTTVARDVNSSGNGLCEADALLQS